MLCIFLPCLSWLLRSRVRKSRRDLWITLYIDHRKNAWQAFSSAHAFRKSVNIRLGNAYCQAQKAKKKLQMLIVFYNLIPLTSHVIVISSWILHPSEPGNKFWLQCTLSRYLHNANTSETQFKYFLRKHTKELAEMFKKSRYQTWGSLNGGVKVITGNDLDKTDDYRRYNRTSGTMTRKRLIEWGKARVKWIKTRFKAREVINEMAKKYSVQKMPVYLKKVRWMYNKRSKERKLHTCKKMSKFLYQRNGRNES